jgi:hypothetical protein
MSRDIKGDTSKQPDGCTEDSSTCSNMKSVRERWESETYACDVCGARYTLFDDEMR